MSYTEKYKGYAWIKSKRHNFDEEFSTEENYTDLMEHHVSETTFLIEEIRKLAKEIDELQYAARSSNTINEQTPV